MNSICKVVAVVAVVMLTLNASASAAGPSSPQTKADPQVVSKLGQLLEQSGYPFRKVVDNVWVVPFEGESFKQFQVIVTSADNLVVIAAVVAEKKTMKVGPEMMFKLLRLVNDIDRVKIGFDDDEDLFIRAEISGGKIDLAEFKLYMEQVSAGADKVHAAIKSYRVD